MAGPCLLRVPRGAARSRRSRRTCACLISLLDEASRAWARHRRFPASVMDPGYRLVGAYGFLLRQASRDRVLLPYLSGCVASYHDRGIRRLGGVVISQRNARRGEWARYLPAGRRALPRTVLGVAGGRLGRGGARVRARPARAPPPRRNRSASSRTRPGRRKTASPVRSVRSLKPATATCGSEPKPASTGSTAFASCSGSRSVARRCRAPPSGRSARRGTAACGSAWDREGSAGYAGVSFDAGDGLRGLPRQRAPCPTAARDADGKLWFATTGGIAVIDPRRWPVNVVPPPVVIEEVVADDRELRPAAGLELPPNTRNLKLRFAALSLTAPERVRFRYRLDGYDDDWHGPVGAQIGR